MEELNRLFKKEVNNIKINMCAKDFFEELEKLGIKTGGGCVNGCQGDYWCRFVYEDIKYCVDGCMYDGVINVFVDEEE